MLVTTVRPVLPRYIHANLHRQTPVVAQRAISGLASSSQPVETSKPRKPSPYRLLSPESFISDFAPLHVAGWRLDQLPYTPTRTSTEEAASDQAENVNTTKGQSSLQGRRLVRMYEFPRGKEGWTKLMQTLSEAGTIIEQEDHHPSIIICPAIDYLSLSSISSDIDRPISDPNGYIVEVATHTHTPLPPLVSQATPSITRGTSAGKIRPGVTGKDLSLAIKIERLFSNEI